MASYQEEIAQLRAQRAQIEHAESAKQICEDYARAKYLRDEAAQRQDADDWHEWDRECESLERTWAMYYKPQEVADPRAVAFLAKKSRFIDTYGDRAIQAIGLAHSYATRARNPAAHNPAHSGMGLQPFSPQYFTAIEDLLELYAKDYGLKYDGKEDALSPNEACRISGLHPNEYNWGVRKMHSEGKDSVSEAAANWNRRV
jgi:hypothetical protein